MTLAQLLALDPAAMWDSLSRDRQMAIVVPLLLSEFAAVTAEDDGTDATNADQETAAGIEHAAFDEAMKAIEAAFPEILGDDLTALRAGPAADMIDGFGKTAVKGIRGRRTLYGLGRGNFVKLGGRKVEIVGWKNLATEDAPIWEGWTQRDVDAERVRRWPDQAVGPFLPAFASVVEPAEPHPAYHEDHSYDRAA